MHLFRRISVKHSSLQIKIASRHSCLVISLWYFNVMHLFNVSLQSNYWKQLSCFSSFITGSTLNERFEPRASCSWTAFQWLMIEDFPAFLFHLYFIGTVAFFAVKFYFFTFIYFLLTLVKIMRKTITTLFSSSLCKYFLCL